MDRSTSSSPAPVKRIPLLIDRNFALLWSGQAISLLGDAAFGTTVILWLATCLAHGAAWAPLAVGAVLLAGEAPEIAVGPLAGVFVDRWDRKHTLLTMDACRAGLLALLISVSGVIPLPVLPHAPTPVLLGAIYLTIALLTAAGQFFGPARLALIGDVVADEHRERASSLAQTSAALTGIVGPAVAAPLFVALGPGWALGLDGLSFLVSFGAILCVQSPPSARSVLPGESGAVLPELLDGLSFIRTNQVLRTLLVAGVLITLGMGAVQALSFFFLRRNLHASAALFGLLGAAEGIGTLLGAAVGGLVSRRAGVSRLVWWSVVVLGILYLVYSRLTSFAPAFVITLLAGAAFAVTEVAETPLLLRATPRELIGRVASILFPAFGLTTAVSALIAGWLASTALRGFHASLLGIAIGPLDTIVAASGFLILTAGLYARANIGMVVAATADAVEPVADEAHTDVEVGSP